jgi:oligosaccharyl transferase (archaeosortase A-associated)
MVTLDLRNRRNYLIAGSIAFFALFALWIRLIPMFAMGKTDIISMVAMDDPFYNLRQVELILANFPGYAWFDPMTYYPHGTSIYWGPLFPLIIAVCCFITGATTRPEIIGTALLVPPFVAAATVMLMYFVGRAFGEWKTGVLASGFTAIAAGQIYVVSWYSYIDHHIAEVFFSTLFCLLYCYAVLSAKDTTIDLKKPESYKKTLFLSFIAGLGYLLGLFTMPTMILFAMIVGIFTVVQCIVDAYRGRSSSYFLVINGTVFCTAIIGLLLFGLKSPGIDLSTYSIGHIYAYLLLIGGTVVLYALAERLKGKEKWYFPLALAGCTLLSVIVLFVASPQIYNLFVSSLFAFFGQQPITNTVEEAMGWSPDRAWLSFNYGLILFAGGVLVMLYNNWKEEHPGEVFALVWSLVMFASTWQHVRYEYYLAINIALLSAVCAAFVFGKGWKVLYPRFTMTGAEPAPSGSKERGKKSSSREKPRKKDRKKTDRSSSPDYVIIGAVVLIAGLGILFAYTSASYSYTLAASGGVRLDPDWREALEWLGNNSPETGVDYLKVYDQATFKYPDASYGVMSWWDYGHMITYIAKRIPNANPFQQGVHGSDGAAAYFVTTSEDMANAILDHDKTRYVVTDFQMDSSKFPAMATWYNSSLAADPYMEAMFIPSQEDQNQLVSRVLNTPLYYLTMVARLHNFDGSMTNATTVYYIEYADPSVTNLSLPVMTNATLITSAEAAGRIEQFNKKAQAGLHAMVIGNSFIQPATDVPALRHYRLIHESPSNVFTSKSADVKFVKVFEYVKGAHIKGTGIIELPLVSNTGRNFTYRQESVSGEFVVPYSTTGSTYGIKALGKYRLSGTGREFDVPEAAVLQGLEVS